MNRKYLNRETKGAADAFDGTQKEIYLEKTPSESSAEEVIHVLGSDIKDVNDSISAMSKQIVAQKARIEAIGKKQKDFDADVRAFQKNMSDPVTGSEFENLGSEFESDKIIKGISMLVENEIQNRITNLEKQLDYEKKNSKIFSTGIEETLAKFLLVEKNLKSTNHKLEDEIREKTAQIIRSERLSAIGELASRLAHDLKNPLTVIKGTVQLLKHNNNGNIDELTKRRIEVIEKSIFRMTHQIDGVLDFVRVTSQKGNIIIKRDNNFRYTDHDGTIKCLNLLSKGGYCIFVRSSQDAGRFCKPHTQFYTGSRHQEGQNSNTCIKD
ncbi:MAG: histidine kinase dimerization/phospho-acceptor domain-containing protein [Candidatus Nitrosotenuis sp.]